jgi:uncharacterized LabA/DUF88 family protein
VDAANLEMNGGYGIQYDVLREFACRDSAEAIRLNVYVPYDEERARNDRAYKRKKDNFFASLREYGYKVIQKKVKWYRDEHDNIYPKANVDLDMAVDALLQSTNLDRVLLATGDGDFVQVVRALQNKGCRVEVVAFNNVSSELRREADMFMSGYLIPDLLPFPASDKMAKWGEVSSRVRAYCYQHRDDQKFGFMRFLKRIAPGLWITDTRHEDSPYESVFFFDSDLPHDVDPYDLPSRSIIFEFDLNEPGREGSAPKASNIKVAAQF